MKLPASVFVFIAYLIQTICSESWEIDYNDTLLRKNAGFLDDVWDGNGMRTISKYVSSNLYVKETPETPFNVMPTNAKNAPVNISFPTSVIIHGWLEYGDKSWILNMKDKYLIHHNYNVIAINWEHYATKRYVVAARKTKLIGRYVGETLISLIQAEKIRTNEIHIVGHSLGAHIAGFAGKFIWERLKCKVGRITALDAAAPLFERPVLVDERKRLAQTDAEFVDAIHTCGGVFGFKNSFAHADFFPNGGVGIQPGCGLIKNDICSHARSHIYYAESINSKLFVSNQCADYERFQNGKCKNNRNAVMGFHVKIGTHGDFFLDTNKNKPFAKG